MTLINRKVAREQLAVLITATGLFEAVHKGRPKKIDGKSPVAIVMSGGSGRNRIMDGTRDQSFKFDIGLCVVRSGERADTSENVETMLDDLEAAIAQICDDNTILTGYWNDLRYDAQGSQTLFELIDGLQYRVELIPVTAMISP